MKSLSIAKLENIAVFAYIFFLFSYGFLNNFLSKSGNYGSFIFDGILIILYIPLFFKSVAYQHVRKLLFFGAYILLFFIVSAFSFDSISNLISGIRNHLLYTFSWIIGYSYTNLKNRQTIKKYISVLGTIICAFAIFQSLFNRVLPEELLNIKGVTAFSIYGVTSYRCNGLIGDMLTFGGFSIVIYLINFAQLYVEKSNSKNVVQKNRINILDLALISIPIASNLLTFSRASIFGMLICIFLSFVIAENKLIKKMIFILILASIALYVLFFTKMGAAILYRFTDTSSFNKSSDAVRYIQYSEALYAMKNNFFFGIGMGSQLGNSNRIVTDGYWFSCLLEMGVPLFVMYFAFFIYTAIDACLVLLKRENNTFSIALVYFLSICYFIVFSFINSSFEVRTNICLVLFIYGFLKKTQKNPESIYYESSKKTPLLKKIKRIKVVMSIK